MKFSRRFIFSCIGVVLSGCSHNPGADVSVPAQDSLQGIYRGTSAKKISPISQATVQVLVEVGQTVRDCTGSVLSRELILTAAHCAFDWSAKPRPALLVAKNLAVLDQGGHSIPVGKMIVHPYYHHFLDEPDNLSLWQGYDLAILQLSQPLPESFSPVVLGDTIQASMKKNLFVAGFGQHSGDPGISSDGSLNFGPITIEPTKNAKLLRDRFSADPDQEYSETSFKSVPANSDFSRILQFEKKLGDARICKGDSGGPLYFEVAGKIHLVGIHLGLDDDGVCNDDTASLQFSTALTSAALGFIQAAAKSLTGQPLAGLTVLAPDEDRNMFQYYFTHPTGAEFNKTLDLRDKALVIDFFKKDGKEFPRLVKLKADAPECKGELVSFLDFAPQISPTTSDGKLPVRVRAISIKDKKPNWDQVFEARVKYLDGQYQFVIATPEGFVTKTFPVSQRCQF